MERKPGISPVVMDVIWLAAAIGVAMFVAVFWLAWNRLG